MNNIEKYFVAFDCHFACESIEELQSLMESLRKSKIAKNAIAYNINTNIIKEPVCEHCNNISEDKQDLITKGQLN